MAVLQQAAAARQLRRSRVGGEEVGRQLHLLPHLELGQPAVRAGRAAEGVSQAALHGALNCLSVHLKSVSRPPWKQRLSLVACTAEYHQPHTAAGQHIFGAYLNHKQRTLRHKLGKRFMRGYTQQCPLPQSLASSLAKLPNVVLAGDSLMGLWELFWE